MKCLILCLVLTIVCGVQSDLLDSLRDGKESVFKFEWEEHVKEDGKSSFSKYEFDALIRKGNEDHSFIVDPHDVKYDTDEEGDEKLSDADVAAIKLPVRVHLDEDYKFKSIEVNSADTKKSLDIKDSVLDLLIIDMTDTVKTMRGLLKDTDSKTLELLISHLPFGDCKTQITISRTEKEYKMEFATKREDCTGDVEEYILKEFDAKTLSPDSTYKIKYYFEKEHFYPNGARIEVFGKDVEHKIEGSFDSKIRFVKLQDIDHEIKDDHFNKQYDHKEFNKFFSA